MPRIIDHDAKRREVAALTRKLIARSGINNVSMRSIAEAAGSSTAVVSYYFSDKNALLLHIYRENIERARARRKAIPRGGIDRLLEFCDELLVTTDEQAEGWAIALVFTAMATSDERFAEEYRTNVILAREQFRVRFSDCVAQGDAYPELDCEAAARRLLALIQGVSTEAALDRTDWSAERQRKLIRDEIESLIGRAIPDQSRASADR